MGYRAKRIGPHSAVMHYIPEKYVPVDPTCPDFPRVDLPRCHTSEAEIYWLITKWLLRPGQLLAALLACPSSPHQSQDAYVKPVNGVFTPNGATVNAVLMLLTTDSFNVQEDICRRFGTMSHGWDERDMRRGTRSSLLGFMPMDHLRSGAAHSHGLPELVRV